MDWETVLAKVRECNQRRNLPAPPAPRLLPQDAGKAMLLSAKLVTLAIDTANAPNIQKLVAPESSGDDVLGDMAVRQLELMAGWLKAHVEGDAEGAAFAWGDRLYALLIEAVAAGLPVDQLFDVAHEMAFLADTPEGPEDGA